MEMWGHILSEPIHLDRRRQSRAASVPMHYLFQSLAPGN